MDDLSINIVAGYLYDLLKNKKARNIKIDNKPVQEGEDIEEYIKEKLRGEDSK